MFVDKKRALFDMLSIANSKISINAIFQLIESS